MTETFETLLCTHSAPVLAGLRPSGTVTCHREKLPFLEQDLAECRRLLLGGKAMLPTPPPGLIMQLKATANNQIATTG